MDGGRGKEEGEGGRGVQNSYTYLYKETRPKRHIERLHFSVDFCGQQIIWDIFEKKFFALGCVSFFVTPKGLRRKLTNCQLFMGIKDKRENKNAFVKVLYTLFDLRQK